MPRKNRTTSRDVASTPAKPLGGRTPARVRSVAGSAPAERPARRTASRRRRRPRLGFKAGKDL